MGATIYVKKFENVYIMNKQEFKCINQEIDYEVLFFF